MEQNTPEWLEFRRNKIGGSDAPIIMGLSPWKTPYRLWEEKVFGKEGEQTAAMNRGHLLESAAREEFTKMTGIPMMPKIVVHPVRDWQMASLDGISLCGSLFVEIKCPNEATHQMAIDGNIPDHYVAQMQHQMSVLDVKEGFYFSFDGKKGVVIQVKRQDDYVEGLIKKEEEFYTLMKNKESPPLSDKDYCEQGSFEWMSIAEQWLQIDGEIKLLEAQKEQVRKQLLQISDGRSSKGGGLRVTKSLCKGLVDYKNIPELKGVDLESYRKPSFEKWTIASCK